MPGDVDVYTNHESDTELVGRIRSGDITAFEQVYRSHYEFLVVFANGYVGSSDIARDIVSDVFFNVWNNRATWTPGAIRTYLCGAVRNRALNEIRNDRNRTAAGERVVAVDGRAPGMGQAERSAEDEVEQGERWRTVWRVIETLPANQREAMMLRWRRQLPFDDIAQIMGVSRAAVHMHLSRAMKTLREKCPAAFD